MSGDSFINKVRNFNTFNVYEVFNDYKDSVFNSFKEYTFNDIVTNWSDLNKDPNDNIVTINYFVNNPDKITCLVFDNKGLADGYHRLIALRILDIKTHCLNYIDEYYE